MSTVAGKEVLRVANELAELRGRKVRGRGGGQECAEEELLIMMIQ